VGFKVNLDTVSWFTDGRIQNYDKINISTTIFAYTLAMTGYGRLRHGGLEQTVTDLPSWLRERYILGVGNKTLKFEN
jgi:hypothetical protein